MEPRHVKTANLAVAFTLLCQAASAQTNQTTVATTTTFSKNTDPSSTSTCVSHTSDTQLGAQRKQTIVWTLQNDTANPCPGFQPARVLIEFKTDVVGSGSKRKVPGHADGTARAKVTMSKTVAPDMTRHRYDVYYDGLLAEDPEIDVNGDCPGCLPK
jgi:hypothetical protein